MLNWIVIGIGDITKRRVIPAIQAEPRSRLYGFVTRDPAKAAPYGVKTWATLDEALADPEVQAVYVGTPVFLHAPQTIQSLRAGKHVLCEKPMAMNEAEARAMVQAAEQSGKTFGVAYYRRCYPKVQRAKQLLHLLYPILDTLGRADFSGASQSTRLLHQVLAMARGPQVHPGAFVRRDRSAGWSFALCSHESSLPLLTGKRRLAPVSIPLSQCTVTRPHGRTAAQPNPSCRNRPRRAVRHARPNATNAKRRQCDFQQMEYQHQF